jgi:hypothetical protein
MRGMSLVAYLVVVGAVSIFALLVRPARAEAFTSQAQLCSMPVPEAHRTTAVEKTEEALPTESCLAAAVCAVQQRIRWRTAAWEPKFCEQIAHTLLSSSQRYHLSPLLLFAIMINESTMNERAVRLTVKDGALYAKDGGLMGIRCVLDKQGRCKNGDIRGMSWSDVAEPTTNIKIAARQLAYWRDFGGVATRRTVVRDSDGRVRTTMRQVHCPHEDHPFWAHYNHGERYIDHGPARYYPYRVGSLYATLSQALQMDDTQVSAGGLARRAGGSVAWMRDRRVGLRQHSLCRTIMDMGPVCRPPATAEAPLQD